MLLVHHGLDLFNYDQKLCSNQLLITAANASSNVDYDEYVVYRRPGDRASCSSKRNVTDEDAHVTHHFTRDDTTGSVLLDLAFRRGYFVNQEVHGGFVSSILIRGY